MAQTQPHVELLWEPGDADDILRLRFGHEDGAQAATWIAHVLEQHWGITVSSCDRIVISDCNALAWVRTDRGSMIAKWCVAADRFARLTALAELVAWLDERCLPVSSPVVARDGRVQVEVDGTSIGLQHVIDGELLDIADVGQVRAVGAATARLHGGLASYPAVDAIPGLGRPSGPLPVQIGGWLGEARAHVPEQALEVLRRRLDDLPPTSLPLQLVHGDVRSANVLLREQAVAAILDFEEARIDHRIVELARSAVLLGTRFRGWGPVSPQVRADFRDGYESVCRLTPAERRWWDVLVLWFSLAMIPPGDDPTGWGAAALEQLGPR